ncbi:MAG: hypothetical protein HMLKMBBP_02496 [Planctomycetes bacterium]|nr:hypothetical protein [Planctomycetota bacterium]
MRTRTQRRSRPSARGLRRRPETTDTLRHAACGGPFLRIQRSGRASRAPASCTAMQRAVMSTVCCVGLAPQLSPLSWRRSPALQPARCIAAKCVTCFGTTPWSDALRRAPILPEPREVRAARPESRLQALRCVRCTDLRPLRRAAWRPFVRAGCGCVAELSLESTGPARRMPCGPGVRQVRGISGGCAGRRGSWCSSRRGPCPGRASRSTRHPIRHPTRRPTCRRGRP